MKKPKIKGLSHGAYCTANISQSIKLNKARERVIRAAKRQVKIWGEDNPLNNSLHNAVTALNNLESK